MQTTTSSFFRLRISVKPNINFPFACCFGVFFYISFCFLLFGSFMWHGDLWSCGNFRVELTVALDDKPHRVFGLLLLFFSIKNSFKSECSEFYFNKMLWNERINSCANCLFLLFMQVEIREVAIWLMWQFFMLVENFICEKSSNNAISNRKRLVRLHACK